MLHIGPMLSIWSVSHGWLIFAGDEFHLACVIIDETDQLRPYYRERPLVRHWLRTPAMHARVMY